MFITFEGVEGSGKSTQIALAKDWIETQGREALATRQPGGCALGLELRRILLDARNTHLDPTAELFMYLADRAQHVAQVVRPALEAGKAVLCDRFHDSTVAYQGFGRGLDVESLLGLGRLAAAGLAPDLTVLLDLDPEQGLSRARGRNHAAGASQSEGRFEALDLPFHQRVRQGFLELARREPARFAVVDASGDPVAVFARVRQALAALPWA
ncbi:Thymidylate kinase [Fundidesulfovibrio magnetotacticus]|uniref:Thymidylate kinase n=1 Tax=Fundidesulfovibrio magnetotacticus TaxID=2730080 RepID=A0A6V8LZD2_9BACT|nr:dTMP kinase [Fundidesulfovibrio magnetotacticus]GFK95588.1 Thymidylate kinase [Fundidesulfovibrio magnetotacticus]